MIVRDHRVRVKAEKTICCVLCSQTIKIQSDSPVLMASTFNTVDQQQQSKLRQKWIASARELRRHMNV